MIRQTFNYCLKDAPGYWNPFAFLTDMREQKVVVDNFKQMVPTYIAIVFHEGTIKFFRISKRLMMKIREICPTGNIADYLWQVRALRKDQTPFFSYEARAPLAGGGFCKSLCVQDNLEVRIQTPEDSAIDMGVKSVDVVRPQTSESSTPPPRQLPHLARYSTMHMDQRRTPCLNPNEP